MFIKINGFYYNEAIIASFGPDTAGSGPCIRFNFIDGSKAAIEFPLSKYNGNIMEAEKARNARLGRLYKKLCQ